MPDNTWREALLDIECLSCYALPGEPCWTNTGKQSTTFHVPRKQLAAALMGHPKPERALRVSGAEARAHFDKGGPVIVSAEWYERVIIVTPDTVTHTNQTTTWDYLVEQIVDWSNRYHAQTYFVPLSDLVKSRL